MWIEVRPDPAGPVLCLIYNKVPLSLDVVEFVRLCRTDGEAWDVQSINQTRQYPQDKANAAFNASVAELQRRAIPGTTLSPDRAVLSWWPAWKLTRPDLSWNGNTVTV